MKRIHQLTSHCLLAAVLMGMLHAPIDAQAAEAAAGTKAGNPEVDALMIKAGFLSSHPDLRYRLHGLEDFKRGKHDDALRFFQRAAYYGDKPSQAMVAEMLWNGQGGERNPVLAYAWMDLAAERGYAGFLGLRERYWNTLNEEERERALTEGQAIYAKYGDAAAQPRLATVLRRERRKITGSRTGFDGNVEIMIPVEGGFEQINGTKFFDEKFWDPKQYQAWHDSIWMKPRVGRVSVGELENVQEGGKPPTSRIPATNPAVDEEEPATPERSEDGLGRPGS